MTTTPKSNLTMSGDVFVEMECCQLNHDGETVCGDDFAFERLEAQNRHLAVLSDGLGSGIKANLLACMTTTMAIEFIRSNMDVLKSAETIMDTLPVCEIRKISYATFTVVDLRIGGKSRLIEMDNPPLIHLRNNKDIAVERRALRSERWPDRVVQTAELCAIAGDRLIAFTDGVSQAGLGQPGNKFGWRREGALLFIQERIALDPAISARDLARMVVNAARAQNKDNKCIDDISCMVIYLRKPRKLRLLTGPPFRQESDRAYAELVRNYDGRIILSGGTSANIVGRELNRKIDLDMKLVKRAGTLPPPAKMQGIDLVTEGILTLTETLQRLERNDSSADVPLAAREIIKLMLESDEIEFIVGTKVNEAHQDPNLPVDLEIRRNIVKRLKEVLENQYRKRVIIRFF